MLRQSSQGIDADGIARDYNRYDRNWLPFKISHPTMTKAASTAPVRRRFALQCQTAVRKHIEAMCANSKSSAFRRHTRANVIGAAGLHAAAEDAPHTSLALLRCATCLSTGRRCALSIPAAQARADHRRPKKSSPARAHGSARLPSSIGSSRFVVYSVSIAELNTATLSPEEATVTPRIVPRFAPVSED